MKTLRCLICILSLLVLLLVTGVGLYPLAGIQDVSAYEVKSRISERIRSFADLPDGLAPALVKALQNDLPAAYDISKAGKKFKAYNKAHSMEFIFNQEGPQIRMSNPALKWSMRLTRWGNAGTVAPVPKARLSVKGARLVYWRGPMLNEWYINTGWGLEQGFTISSRPSASGGQQRELELELTFSGTLQPKLRKNTLLLCDSSNQVIARYTGLYVHDVDGNSLPAHLELSGDRLRILVDDSAARYPITIDPWVQQAKLTASDGKSGDWFGCSVAVSNDTVVVGARYDTLTTNDEGSAYIFEKAQEGWANMTQTAKLTARDAALNDRFGCSVDIYNNTVVVGAYYRNMEVGGDQGAVYVFEKPQEGWSDMNETAKLTASDAAGGDCLGGSVAMSSETVVAGAGGEGAAYVFKKPLTGWIDMTETAKLTASDGASIGCSVGISSDTVVVGAGVEAAYIFEKPGGGWASMTETAKLTASDGVAGDYFGYSVDISSGTVVVGAYGDDDNGSSSGSAYVFVKPASGWKDMTETAKLTASDGGEDNRLGYSVSIFGDTIVVGAYHDEDNGSDSGSAYIFIRPLGGWSGFLNETAKLTASDGSAGDFFGSSVSINQETVVIGAREGDGNVFGSGSAYVFSGPSSPNGSSNFVPWLLLLLLSD